jgi:hypothetical protein
MLFSLPMLHICALNTTIDTLWQPLSYVFPVILKETIFCAE